MNNLPEILHNIAEHTETLHQILSEEGITSEVKERMVEHIILEEKENSERLTQLHGREPSVLTQKLLDHSFFLQKMVNDQSMSHALKLELLHHFIEEHQEWQQEHFGGGVHAAHGAHFAMGDGAGVAVEAPGASSAAAHGVDSSESDAPYQWTVGPMWHQGG